MKKRIIFIKSFIWLDFHYKLYEIEKFKKYYDVDCYDLTYLKNKDIYTHYKYLKNKFRYSKFYKFSLFKKKILELLKKYENNLIICFLHFPTTFFELYIYYLLIKKKANVCIFDFIKFQPSSEKKKIEFKDHISYIITRIFTRPRQVISHRKIIIINLITKKFLNVICPKYIFVNSKKNYFEYRKKLNNTKVFRLHDWDGSNFIMLNKREKKKNLATYLSAFSLNSASDSAHYNTYRLENSKNILESLDRFFSSFEKTSNLKIQVAKHPREEENFKSPIYKNNKRLASKYLTGELVKSSKLVITTMSSAISYAILLKKPILFIITNEHFKNISLINSTKAISKYLKSDLINIDLNKNYKINLIIKNKTKKRYKYITKNYLISEKYKNEPNHKILLNLFR